MWILHHGTLRTVKPRTAGDFVKIDEMTEKDPDPVPIMKFS
jgi:hypothetical protein